MNALLQHRGHVLLSAGHSIAVQNFNEQLNILLMVAMYTLLLWLQLPINIIIVMFGTVVAVLMVVFMRWCKRNLQANPELQEQIGQEGHGRALGSNPPRSAFGASGAPLRTGRAGSARPRLGRQCRRPCVSLGRPVTHTGQLWRFSAAAPIGRA